ncbi:hypothetical membrane protein [Treponema paraluiscuniculi Cuniculi A]|uniref:Membrane protein n=2 Tax=Treponema paraluiscuniculi TaxID=53435 RepID=A0ABY9E6T8_9SPIR|nr:hypothetical protein [Treponema paraluiscuniculi]AEH40224.1 hypothetical membrane protein [Treponema paraluiscuniculi Cuniculi A]WKC72158.1 putative membrane protein [Treponema paraluiscuniculi]
MLSYAEVILFLIKKHCIDCGEAFFGIVVLNALCLAGVGYSLLWHQGPGRSVLFVLVLATLYACLCAFCVVRGERGCDTLADTNLRVFTHALREVWLQSLWCALLQCVLFRTGKYVCTYYFARTHSVSTACGILSAWTYALACGALLWFVPVRARYRTHFRQCVYLSARVFFEHPCITFLMVLYSMGVLALSVPMAFLFPGPCGIVLLWQDVLRTLCFRRAWLAAHEGRKAACAPPIPWEQLMCQMRAQSRAHTVGELFSPWKS